jgi:hypothetical protein
MRGQTGIFWANLTPFSLQLPALLAAWRPGEEGGAAIVGINPIVTLGNSY